MKRALSISIALALTSACSLLLDPSSHTGHTRDAGASDGSPGLDAGPHDAGSGDANGGPGDGGPDAWAPPECTTPADCGAGGAAGLVQCLSSRCVFCATPSETTPFELRHGANLRPYVSMAIRHRPTGPALVVVGTMGTNATQPPLAHAAPIDAPSTATQTPILSSFTTCGGSHVTSLTAIDLYPDDTFTGSTDTFLGIVGEAGTSTFNTQLTWMSTGTAIASAGAACNSDTAPAASLPGSTMLAAYDSAGTNRPIFQMVRQSDGMGSFSYVGYQYPSATRNAFFNGFMAPTTSYAPMTSAGPFMVLGGVTSDVVVWWDPSSEGGGLSFISTPTRSGDASAVLLGDTPPTMADQLLHFSLAYPVGNLVRFVNVDCTSTCIPVGDAVDASTGSMVVSAARVALAAGVPVLLTSEGLASGEQRVVLRVLRANYTSYDAPGHVDELVLDTAAAGSTVSDIELAVLTGATTRYAAVWVVTDGSGGESIRMQTFSASCP